MKLSPLAPVAFPKLPAIAGVRLSAVSAGVRYSGRADLMLAELAEGTAVAGVFTLSKTSAAPVDWCRKALKQGNGKAICLLVNSGNANAFTGIAGEDAVRETVQKTASLMGCVDSQIFVASTGVIGEPLPHEKITAALGVVQSRLRDDAWEDAANAIMTTDTFPKGATQQVTWDDNVITINGIAKGSGMIAPHMGTMLAFVFTDAAIAPDLLQGMLNRRNDQSFNAITVDSDTSTSDTVLLFATGKTGEPIIVDDDPRAAKFEEALSVVLQDLAHQIVKDGEGATKFVTIEVHGAEDDAAARKIGLAIGNSPLVKTAVSGCDPNWGRIVMAVGKAGEKADRDKLAIWIGDVLVAENGQVHPEYRERSTAEYMQGEDIFLKVDVGVGNGKATVWTCDLTKRYIEINADYRS